MFYVLCMQMKGNSERECAWLRTDFYKYFLDWIIILSISNCKIIIDQFIYVSLSYAEIILTLKDETLSW